jgi:hypothetical protein
VTVLRRTGATSSDIHAAFEEVSELGIELESFRRREPA